MIQVTKNIISGTSHGGETVAVGDLEVIKQTGIMSCGNGDDHTLRPIDRKVVANHDPKDGNLELPPGRLCTSAPRPCV